MTGPPVFLPFFRKVVYKSFLTVLIGRRDFLVHRKVVISVTKMAFKNFRRMKQ